MNTRQVVLWRHGRTAWNLAGRVQGTSDIELDDVGRRQAHEAAQRLAELGPTRIISSDLARAHATAQALGDVVGVEVELEPRFREIHFGAREGLTWQEAWEQFPVGMKAWVSGDETQIPDSETHRGAGDRFTAGLHARLAETEDEVVVVVAHGGVIRSGACAFLGFPLDTWGLFGGLDNCSWSVLQETRHEQWSRWRMTEWNADNVPRPVLSDDQ